MIEIIITLTIFSIILSCIGFCTGWVFGESTIWVLSGGLIGLFWPITLTLCITACVLVFLTSPIWLSVMYYLEWKEDNQLKRNRE